jgi:hypothetical protein
MCKINDWLVQNQDNLFEWSDMTDAVKTRYNICLSNIMNLCLEKYDSVKSNIVLEVLAIYCTW